MKNFTNLSKQEQRLIASLSMGCKLNEAAEISGLDYRPSKSERPKRSAQVYFCGEWVNSRQIKEWFELQTMIIYENSKTAAKGAAKIAAQKVANKKRDSKSLERLREKKALTEAQKSLKRELKEA